MRLAVMSDIHGNLEALNAVWEDLHPRGVDAVYCVGDMIGYGPDPLEVFQFMEANGVKMLQGNHEWALAGVGRSTWFNFLALDALQKTRTLLGRDAIRRLQRLPYAITAHGCRFVHGMPPVSTLSYLFKASDVDLAVAFRHLRQHICFLGHTHMLGWMEWSQGEVVRHCLLDDTTVTLSPESKHLVNVGSVGQPRDVDKRAKYCIWDDTTRELNVIAVEYDAEATALKIIARGIPRAYASRLLRN